LVRRVVEHPSASRSPWLVWWSHMDPPGRLTRWWISPSRSAAVQVAPSALPRRVRGRAVSRQEPGPVTLEPSPPGRRRGRHSGPVNGTDVPSAPSGRSAAEATSYQRLREHLAYLQLGAAAENLSAELDRGLREKT